MAIGRHIERHRKGWRRVELTLQGSLIAVLGGMLIYAVMRVVGGDLTQCQRVSTDSRAGLALAGVALAGFVGGRLLGYARRLIHETPPLASVKRSRPKGIVQGFLLLFLVGATLLLAYETFAVFQPDGNPPAVTTYVRCAAAAGGWISGVGAFLVGLLLGSWLWYQTVDDPWKGFR